MLTIYRSDLQSKKRPSHLPSSLKPGGLLSISTANGNYIGKAILRSKFARSLELRFY